MDAIAGYVDAVWVPFKKIDACQTITPKCPLSANTTATFNFGLTISNDYPMVSDEWTGHCHLLYSCAIFRLMFRSSLI